ncbi:MAG: RNA-binding S4 domain-containing protein [Rhodobacteraceae bacterium]|nr:RNA-binding S4 domain-containing protein [Paracoccaceae bacterium]
MTELTSLRVDKWLWQARFFKSRALAAKVVTEGKLRVNSTPISKPSRSVAPGDVLTFPKEQDVRVIKILALGSRRGPAPEAQSLYEDLAPPQPKPKKELAPGHDRTGRPTKRDRRALDALKRDL